MPGGLTLTYAELLAHVQKSAATLAEAGLKPGNRTALVYPNGLEAVILFLATATVGIACPLNPAYTEDEFRFYLEDTGADALLVPSGGADAARRAMSSSGLLIEAEFEVDGQLSITPGGHRPRSVLAMPKPDDVALILHTSGTTSRPKRVPLKHRNLTASVRNIVDWYKLSSDDVSLVVMPLFHVHGLIASVLSTLASGGTAIIPSKFTALGFWPLIKTHRVTWYSSSPTFHQLVLMRAPSTRPAGVDSLRFVRSCSAALSPATLIEMEERFGVPVVEAYGMTEATHQMASNPLPPRERRPGTVGPGSGVTIAVMDEGGHLVAPGEPGEVVIMGPNVIDGYEGNREADAISFRDGWFRTGDRGVLDRQGYLTLIGRIKELIIRGGEKIGPREVDEVLELHPAVKEAVSFGVPHPTWGEEVAAAIVLEAEATERELIAHCRQHLAEFKIPKRLYFVEKIPRTATGKVQRRDIAAALTQQS